MRIASKVIFFILATIAMPAIAGQIYSLNWYEWSNPGIGPTTEVIVFASDDSAVVDVEVMWQCAESGVCHATQSAMGIMPGAWMASFHGVTGVTSAAARVVSPSMGVLPK